MKHLNDQASLCMPGASTCGSVRADIVFVVDSSGSIRDNNPNDESYDNWALMLQFMQNIVDQLSIGEDETRVGMVRFSNFGDSIFYLNSYYNKEALKDAIGAIAYDGGNTNTSGGLRVMMEEQFIAANGDRADAENIGIVITDGVSTMDTQRTIPDAEAARDAGIKLYAVGITNNINVVELQGISSLPQRADENYFTSSDFRALDSVVETLVSQTCTGVLSDCSSTIADIVLILDSSSSVRDTNPGDNSYDNWNLMLEFAADIVEQLPIGTDEVRLGVIRYADSAENMFFLNTFTTKSTIQSQIRSLGYMGGSSNTADAIETARLDQFTTNRGDRSSAQNIAILVTDGVSSRNEENTIPYARLAQEDDIRIFVVGVSGSVDENELLNVASYPHVLNANYWKVASFPDLTDFVSGVTQYVCLDKTSRSTLDVPLRVCAHTNTLGSRKSL